VSDPTPAKDTSETLTPVKRAAPPYRELAIRVASALALVPLVLWTVHLGEGYFLMLISVGFALLATEWSLMATPAIPGRMACAITLTGLGAIFTTYLGHPVLGLWVLVFGSMCIAVYAHRLGARYIHAAYGALYIGLPGVTLIWLRADDLTGRDWVYFAFLIAWAADSAAYLAGKLFGGPKLWVKYSPNKTWSGFAGGLVAGMLIAGLLSDFTHLFRSSTSAQIVGLLTALATMAGDLWESMLKRRFGVKDSGTLIPGHGGLLDRVDGLLFAIVVIGAIRLLVLLGTII
jgi:phosphatidate cytidylyltransferase